MTQKDAVYDAILRTLAGANITLTNGIDASTLLTKELRAQVTTYLVLNFQGGLVELSDDAKQKFTDSVKLRAYVSGLVSNWLKKDSRLNGGTTVPKVQKTVNRTSNDPQLKAMRHLLAVQTDPNKRAEIQQVIDRRAQELNQTT